MGKQSRKDSRADDGRGLVTAGEIVAARGDHSTGHEIGFNSEDLILAPPVSDSQAQFVTELVITDENKLESGDLQPALSLIICHLVQVQDLQGFRFLIPVNRS